MPKTCKIHKEVELTLKWNSSTYNPCFKCESEKRNKKNKEILGQSSFYSKKSSGNGLKSNSGKLTPSKKKTIYNTTAWKYFSRYVLVFHADKSGYVKCCTCNTILHVTDKKMHCGHFHKADAHKATAFEFKNNGPQDYRCNRHFSGNPHLMAKWIENIHGKGTLEYLDIKKNNTCHLDKYELDILRVHWKKEYEKLLKERQIKDPWKK